MRRSLWLCLLLSVLVIGAGSQAIAQYEDQGGQKYAIFVGVFMPSGSMLRDEASIWKTFGASMNLKMDDLGRPHSTISLEHATTSADHLDARRTSITYMKLYRNHQKADVARGVYYGVGAGIHLVMADIAARPFIFPPVTAEKKSGIQPGITVLGGYDFSEHFYAELRYTKMGELMTGVDFSGINLTIGTRSLF